VLLLPVKVGLASVPLPPPLVSHGIPLAAILGGLATGIGGSILPSILVEAAAAVVVGANPVTPTHSLQPKWLHKTTP
jgi:hypothetical protein